MLRVWIAYEPLVFRETLIQLLRQVEWVTIVEDASQGVDLGIFRLAETGLLQDFFRHAALPEAKLIVMSPRGDRGFIRQAGEKTWREVRPFGTPQLLHEIWNAPTSNEVEPNTPA